MRLAAMVVRELSCDEEQEIMACALEHITIKGEVIEPDLADSLAHTILSTISHMGYKIVEGMCDG